MGQGEDSDRDFNPLKATEMIQQQYLNFIRTSFAPNNPTLKEKFQELSRNGLLWREPYISISQNFKKGRKFENYVKINGLSDLLLDAFKIDSLYLHQDKAISNILNNRNTIVASGTGSGKTEIFFIPSLDYCIKNRNEGIKVIIVYPMNSLANDQMDRLRNLLFHINRKLVSPITFGMYTGQTPDYHNDEFKSMCSIPYICPHCNREELFASSTNNKSYFRCNAEPEVMIDYQLLTRKEIKENPPDILITNYVQLQYLMLRKDDERIFLNNRIKYVILDELHTYGGARGIDVSLLVRRFKRRIVDSGVVPLFIGTSATLSRHRKSEERRDDIAEYASKLYGSPIIRTDVFEGEKEDDYLSTSVASVIPMESLSFTGDLENRQTIQQVCKILAPNYNPTMGNDKVTISKLLHRNEFFRELIKLLNEPMSINDLSNALIKSPQLHDLKNSLTDVKAEIWNYLKLASSVPHPNISNINTPMVRVNVHNFFKSVEPIFCCTNCLKLYISQRDFCDRCDCVVEELGVCRYCGKEFLITYANEDKARNLLREDEENEMQGLINKHIESGLQCFQYMKASNLATIWQTYEFAKNLKKMKKCIRCGSLLPNDCHNCNYDRGSDKCNSTEFKEVYLLSELEIVNSEERIKSYPHFCPFCNNSYGTFSALSNINMSPDTASSTLFDLVFSSLPRGIRKMLIFTDNRQSASRFAAKLEEEHLTHTIRNLLFVIVKENSERISYRNLTKEASDRVEDWYGGDPEAFGRPNLRDDTEKKVTEELISFEAKQRSLENLGLLETEYRGLESLNDFRNVIAKSSPLRTIKVENDEDMDNYRKYLICLLNIVRNKGAFSNRNLIEKEFPDRNVIGFVLSTTSASRGIDLKNILGDRAKPLKFTMGVFDLHKDDKDAGIEIIKESFEILKNVNLLILKNLRYGKNASAQGYVVNESYC